MLPDTVQLIKVIHRDDRSDRAAVALDDDLLAAFRGHVATRCWLT